MQQQYNHEQITTIAAVTLLIYEYVKLKTEESDTDIELHEMDYKYDDTILKSTVSKNINQNMGVSPLFDTTMPEDALLEDNSRVESTLIPNSTCSSDTEIMDIASANMSNTELPTESPTSNAVANTDTQKTAQQHNGIITKNRKVSDIEIIENIPNIHMPEKLNQRSGCLCRLLCRNLRYQRAIKHAMTTLEETSEGRVVFFLNNKKTDLQVGITVNDTQKRIIVVFRGSASLKNYRFNFKICKKTLHDNVKVHSGFYHQLHNGGSIDFINDKIFRLINLHPTYTVYCTGHSMGGSVATLYGYLLAKRKSPSLNVIVISFGSPRLGNKEFKDTFESMQNLFHVRVMSNYDIVTKMPWYHYYHVGLGISTTAIQTMYGKSIQVRKKKYRHVMLNHSMTTYYCSIVADFC